MSNVTAIGEWPQPQEPNFQWGWQYPQPYYPGHSWTSTAAQFTTENSEAFDSWRAAMECVGILVTTGEAVGKPVVAREETRFGNRWVVRWQTRLYAINGG